MNYQDLKKKWIETGEAPEWVSTNAVQFFSQEYSYKGETWKEAIQRVSKYLASYAPKVKPDWWEEDPYTSGKDWEEVFFNCRWDGFILDSTPLLANALIEERGMTISCSGQSLLNSLAEESFLYGELVQLVKNSHGCAFNFVNWLADGDVYDVDGNRSDGILPIIKEAFDKVTKTNQGVRRGQVVFGVNIEHGDFYKVADYLKENSSELNIAWHIKDSFIDKLLAKDKEAFQRLATILTLRIRFGKGYITKLDTMNRNKADVFKNLCLQVTGSNLCNEVNLPSNDIYTFSCPIINSNLVLWRKFPKNLFKLQLIMQDCNVSGYLDQIDKKKGKSRLFLEKIYNFTKDFRSVGCGTAGFHSLLMKEGITLESFEALALNDEIFSEMRKDTYEASEWLGKVLGVPPRIKESGVSRRNATTMFSPPTKSSAELARETPSEGIGLQTALVKVKEVSGTDIFRIEPQFLKLLKSLGKYDNDVIKSIVDNHGSCQHLDFLTDQQKKVFRTAFELPMEAHLELCAGRQPYFDQQQSINLYFSGSDSDDYITKIHMEAIMNDLINGLYYAYSIRGGKFNRDVSEGCTLCE